MNIKLPKRGKGRPSPKTKTKYQNELIVFADAIKEINSLDLAAKNFQTN
ncbi:unnamed protein product [marine sediment metagenome]|uniref:Uncharacterized protein n=1 Tax=marine sediment metagenome TaxID=412755 RepID=X1TEA7_9ZZZZ